MTSTMSALQTWFFHVHPHVHTIPIQPHFLHLFVKPIESQQVFKGSLQELVLSLVKVTFIWSKMQFGICLCEWDVDDEWEVSDDLVEHICKWVIMWNTGYFVFYW
jgi:hypothetical protein